MPTEVVHAFGHVNVSGTNRTTFEVTKETHLSKMGDCIIAVSADKSLKDFSAAFKDRLRRENALVLVRVEADGVTDVVRAFGNPGLTFTHRTDIVVRKSDFVSDRTLGIRADKSACDISRTLVRKLQNPDQKVNIIFSVEG